MQGKKEKAGAVVLAEKNVFSFIGDINSLLDRAASESISHSRDDKSADHLSLRNAQVCCPLLLLLGQYLLAPHAGIESADTRMPSAELGVI